MFYTNRVRATLDLLFTISKNFHFIVVSDDPGQYLHGRQGDCWLKLKWRADSKGFSTEQVQIHFDTEPFLPNALQKLFSCKAHLNEVDVVSIIDLNWDCMFCAVIAVLPGSRFRLCESVDEDPGRGCLPVNCLLKYSGFRSFYNRTRRKCQSSPTCLGRSALTLESERKPNTVKGFCEIWLGRINFQNSNILNSRYCHPTPINVKISKLESNSWRI